MIFHPDIWHVGSRSRLKVKVIDRSSRPRDKSAPYRLYIMNARYRVTYTFRIAKGQRQTCTQHLYNYWLYIEFTVKIVGATSSK